MDKFAFIVGVYNRVPELYAHLDILKFCPTPHDIIVVYAGPGQLKGIDNVVKIEPGRGGVLVALLNGIEEARKRGIRYVCYRNADDWLFKQELVEERVNILRNNQRYAMIGHTWYATNRFDDIALNEVYLDLDSYKHIDTKKWESNIRNRHEVSVEHVVTEILRPTEGSLYRLKDREIPNGIGFQTHGDLDRSNNRWIHRTWQLITAHNPWMRWDMYESLRRFIPYAEELERQPNFAKWVKTCMLAEQTIPQMQIDKRTLMDQTKAFHIVETLMECMDIPGDVAELGVYMGGSLKMIANLVPEKIVHGFDSFWGIPHTDAGSQHYKGEFACSLEEVKGYVANRNVVFHPGVFPETTVGLENTRYSFVHVDADVYQSTRDAITYFWPRMNPGGWMLFDDYHWEKCPGVDRAIHEVLHGQQIIVRPESPNQCMVQKNG